MGYNKNWHCYAKVIRPIESETTRTVTHEKDFAASLVVGERNFILHKRERRYSEIYHHKHIPGAPYITRLDQTDAGDWNDGDPASATVEFRGEFSERFSFVDSAIRFLDLRHDIVVLDETAGEVTGEASGDSPIGEVLCAFAGASLSGEPLMKTLNVDTVVGVAPTFHRTYHRRSIIHDGEERIVAEVESIADLAEFYLGITAFEPIFVGSFSFTAFYAVWGEFDVVDTSKPYVTPDQFTPLYNFPATAADMYDSEVLSAGRYSPLDEVQATVYTATWGETSEITTEYLVPFQVDVAAHGGWGVDLEGARLYSQKTVTGVFNVGIAEGAEIDPIIFMERTDSPPVCYPLAPV